MLFGGVKKHLIKAFRVIKKNLKIRVAYNFKLVQILLIR